MAMFWPIFVALIVFGILTYFFGVTRKIPLAKAMLFVMSGVFFLLTAAMVQSSGIMIDWPDTMNQATIDGNNMTTITYITITSEEGTDIWMLTMGMIALSIVPLISALLVVAEAVRGRKDLGRNNF